MKQAKSDSIKILHYDVIGSTNMTAKEMLRSGSVAPFCLVADKQTNGAGRFGRNFYSPAGGVYMTLVLPQKTFNHEFSTGFVAVCLITIIQKYLETNRKANIKWVNDIYIDGKKVSGILIEKVADSFIIGIGVNLKQMEEIPSEFKDRIDFLHADANKQIFIDEVIKEITTKQLDKQQVIKQYLEHCPLIGKTIETGEIISLNFDGSLNVRTANGEIIKVIA